MKKRILVIISTLLLSAVCVGIYYTYSTQDHYILTARPLDKDYKFEWETPFEEKYLSVEKKNDLHAVHFKADKPKGAVLYLHGRGRNLATHGVRANHLVELGYDVLMIDYRGFGKSTNGVSEKTLLADSLAAYTYLASLYKESEIIVYGQSLGSSLATWTAMHNNPSRLILESPFISMERMACQERPYIPEFIIKGILRYPLRTDTWIANVPCFVNIIHGDNDTLVPIAHGRKLVELKGDDIQLHMIEGGSHNNLRHLPEYRDILESIL